jgi:hypothetical protein
VAGFWDLKRCSLGGPIRAGIYSPQRHEGHGEAVGQRVGAAASWRGLGVNEGVFAGDGSCVDGLRGEKIIFGD